MIKVTTTTSVNLTPDHPTYIAGHAMRTEKFKGVHDEIEAIMLGLQIDGIPFLWIEADISNFDCDFAHLFKYYIVETLHIPYDHIILSADHSHSAPLLLTRNPEMPHDDGWRKEVFKKLIAGAQETMNKEFREVARVQCTKGDSQGYYGNRNAKDKYGDTSIVVIEFKDETDATISALVNMSCHSTVLSPEEYQISGDLLAAVRRELIPYLNVTPLVCNGNAGDMSNRLYRQNNDFNELKRVSSGIAWQISQFDTKLDLTLAHPQSKTFVFPIEYDPDIDGLKARLADSQAKLEKAVAYDDRKWLISEINGFQRKIKAGHVKIDLEVTILRMQDLEIVVLPCELVSAFGRQIKKSSQAKVCFVWGYANGQNGYVVEASEFGGGHDGISTQLPKGKAEEFVALIIQHLFNN